MSFFLFCIYYFPIVFSLITFFHSFLYAFSLKVFSSLSYFFSYNSTTHPSNQCNCRVKNTCPLLGKCQYKNVIYKVTVKTNNSIKHYIRATEGIIKQRIYNHKLSFCDRKYSSNISLSLYPRHLKDTNISPTITWEMLKLAPA